MIGKIIKGEPHYYNKWWGIANRWYGSVYFDSKVPKIMLEQTVKITPHFIPYN